MRDIRPWISIISVTLVPGMKAGGEKDVLSIECRYNGVHCPGYLLRGKAIVANIL